MSPGDVPTNPQRQQQPVSAQDEVATLLSQLIQINTSNPTHPERPAAEWVASQLGEVGIESEIVESERGRASVLARVEGQDPSRAPLLIHGHLDVVPAQAQEWTVDPFGGEIRDGLVWGRGAVDMKDMDAMTLAVIREWRRTGTKPPRDIVLAFVADEEAGGTLGAHYLVDHRPDFFADCTEAISEVGGFSVSLNEQARLYLIQTAEKGIGWLRLKAKNRPGHGSMVHPDNAVTQLARAVTRFGEYQSPVILTDTMRELFDDIAGLTGMTFDENDPDTTLQHFGAGARMLGAAIRNTSNPTMLEAGYKANVIPSSAEATIDTRFLPGQEQAWEAKVAELAGNDVDFEWLHKDIAVETTFDGAIVDAMVASLKAEDPGAHPVPYLMSGGTDAKSFSTLGVRCFGFSPLLLPPDLDFTSMFHGIDERVPVDSLQFGCRVLARFLAAS
jgi:acetylornithine deacetylase/succinyl-diaminopimelate desuccinylase-like protein